jgi:hypothetical protein
MQSDVTYINNANICKENINFYTSIFHADTPGASKAMAA